MSVFTDANGNRKNVLLIKAFCLSLLFLIIFVLAYMLSADLVARVVGSDTGTFFEVWLPPTLISLLATAVCCALIPLFEDKLLVPASFAFFAVYYLICLIALYATTNQALLQAGSHFLMIYLLPPVIIGNSASWGIYALIRKHNTASRKKAR